jgi:cation transport ATPase
MNTTPRHIREDWKKTRARYESERSAVRRKKAEAQQTDRERALRAKAEEKFSPTPVASRLEVRFARQYYKYYVRENGKQEATVWRFRTILSMTNGMLFALASIPLFALTLGWAGMFLAIPVYYAAKAYSLVRITRMLRDHATYIDWTKHNRAQLGESEPSSPTFGDMYYEQQGMSEEELAKWIVYKRQQP